MEIAISITMFQLFLSVLVDAVEIPGRLDKWWICSVTIALLK